MKRYSLLLFLTLILLLLPACAQAAETTGQPAPSRALDTAAPEASLPAVTVEPSLAAVTASPTPAADTALPSRTTERPVDPPASPQPSPASTRGPEDWTELPVVPVIDEPLRRHLEEIYRRGQELGNDSLAFSKVGDCGSTPSWFLGDFDRGPRYYSLGEFGDLEEVIGAYSGSFERTSLAAKSGFTTSSVLAPLWADRKLCESNETPLDCEYRLHRPSIALITLGTNDVWHPEEFEPQLRVIIETSLEKGVIPVLATKADNLEGDGSLNAVIARLATEYQVPLWNYWLAVQPLPDQGLQEDGAHITWGPNRFDDPQAMQKGWTVRNLTALQVLDAIYQALEPIMEES